MKKIKILMILMFAFTLSACGNSYTRDTSPGQYIEISYDELLELYENEETFFAIFSQTTCGGCIDYKENVLEPYLEDHNITIYEINFTEELDPQDSWNAVIETYEDFQGTPFSIFVENGIDKDNYTGEMSEDDFDELVIKYELDKLEE